MQIALDRTMSIQDQDTALLKRIAAGDASALHALYAEYGQRLYAYAHRLTNDPVLAEDVLQESLVAVWKGAGRYRGQGRVIAWLLGIVHNQARLAIRRKPLPSLDVSNEEPPSDNPLPDEDFSQQEQRQLVRDSLKLLSVEHRTVLELVFYQGLSLNEVAEVCATPVGTVKSRLNYAKAQLRGILNRAGLGPEEIG
jgi:RNA polymerase sigma-70 factor (ECF subfamily)